MVKKSLMTFVWRVSQTGPLLSLFFWSIGLAGIFWPIVGVTATGATGPLWDFIVDVLGVPPDRVTFVGLAILFLLFASFIIIVGILYDRVLKLWREQMDVVIERNPYADDKLYRKERMQWDQFYLPLARAVHRISPDPELKEAIVRVEDWVATGRMKPR